MRPALRLAALVLLLGAALPAAADKAKSLYDQGKDADARQKYEEAYDYYRQAYQLKPKDLRYRLAFEHSRFLAGAAHVHQGQLLRDAGKLQEALAEFKLAAEIDPASFIAQQEARRTQDLINAATAPPPPTPPTEIAQRLAQAAGPAELAPIQQLPITLSISENAKMVYQTIGQIAGINVLFDPDYTSPSRITVKLNNVTLEEALDIVNLESRSFYRTVTSNTIFVVNDTPNKRREMEQQVLKTFYLSNLSSPTDIQDLRNVFNTVLELQQNQPLVSQGAIVVRGSPDKVALAQKVIDDIDRARPEVVIDVAVMQVRRDKLRNLGINPVGGSTPTATAALQPNLSTTTGTTTTGTTTTGTPGQINLNKLANLHATDFVVTLPTATANLLFTDSTSRVIQNPQIRATDGAKATLKIGDRIPVAMGSFQPGIGGVGINPLVNTQFQYQDVGVNIDITPHVHANREVSMKLSLEISSVTSRTNIGGIDQPIIGQRKIDHEIRLKEGEVNILGGIFEDQDIKNLSGLPGLSQVPLLKYLFSSNSTERVENEIIFVLVPHIVRAQVLTDLNLRAIDIGSAGSVGLRRRSRAATSGAAAPRPAVQPQPQATPAPPPGEAPAATAPAAGGELSFDPPLVNQAAGATFTVNINVRGAQNLAAVPVQVSFDPARLQLLNVSNGSFLSRDGQIVVLTHREDEATGTAQISAARPPGAGGVSGDGPLFTLTFLAKASGSSSLVINRANARNASDQAVPFVGAQATVNVK